MAKKKQQLENTEVKNEKPKKVKKERKWWFCVPKTFLRLIISKPKFKYLDEENIEEGSIILSNHEGASGPLKLELYLNHSFKLWGAWQMNSNLVQVYKYLSKTYYHQKKHWPLFWARVFCIIAAPVTFCFYRGLNLISTYPDARLKTTIKKSLETIDKNQSIVLFPEDSSTGYHKTLTGFHTGFALLAKTCLKKGKDVPIYVTYLDKEKNTFIFDKPVKISKLLEEYGEEQKIADALCERINEIKELI